jgi:glutaredoxin 3
VTVRVLIYTSGYCPYCIWAKRLLDAKGAGYEELRVDREPGLRQEMTRRSGRHTVPQIFIGDLHVGGFDDLAAMERAGRLDPLLSGEISAAHLD